jgi:NADPH:quinone reductase-like Zn-dependent oxidoreductase
VTAPTETASTTGTIDPRRDTNMKAITHHRFGGPDALHFEDVERPAPGAGELLVEVAATGVNQGDALELRGWPLLARLMGFGIRRPSHPVLGTDIAGRVIAVGADVADIDVDQDVVGWGIGGLAELATLEADTTIVRPDDVAAIDAAALPTAGVAALQAVRDAGRVEAGQHVLVIGASGGVGTFAVQIAKAFGAEVTGVAGAANAELVRSIGADHVVDHRRDDVAAHIGRYDVVIDLVGAQSIGDLQDALTPRGTLVVVGGGNPRTVTGMRRFAAAALRSAFTRRRLVPLFSTPKADDLATLMRLVRDGAVRPVVGATFALGDAAEAFRRLETHHATGKLVVTP